MNLNKRELRKILYDFHSISNRLFSANIHDYIDTLKKFLRFLSETEIISDYITMCGKCELDVKQEIERVCAEYGRSVLPLGDTPEEETRNTFAVLNYIANKNENTLYSLILAYAGSTHLQDDLKSFNARYVKVLYLHIDKYLTNIGFDMGLDENVIYNVSSENGQAIVASDNAVVNAQNSTNITNGVDFAQLDRLIEKAREQYTVQAGKEDEAEVVEDSLSTIQEEVHSSESQNRKRVLKMAVNALKVISAGAGFTAAVTEIIQFLQPLL